MAPGAAIVNFLVFFIVQSNEGDQKHEILVETTLRNFLVIRYAFPMEDGYWVTTTQKNQGAKLRPRRRLGRIKAAGQKDVKKKTENKKQKTSHNTNKFHQFVADQKTSVTNTLKHEGKKVFEQGKAKIKEMVDDGIVKLLKPVVGELAAQVAEKGGEFVNEVTKELMDETRPPNKTSEQPVGSVLYTCRHNPDVWYNFGSTCWVMEKVTVRIPVNFTYRSRFNYASDLIHVLLDDLADPKRSARRKIVATKKKLIELKSLQNGGARSSLSPISFRKVLFIVNNLLKIAGSLAITSIENINGED